MRQLSGYRLLTNSKYGANVSRTRNLRIREYNLVVLALVLFIAAVAPKTMAAPTSTQEYQVKAAFLYNFLQFVDWPEGKFADDNKPITIGIIGKDPFRGAFEPVKDKKVKDRNVVIKRFKGFKALKESGAKDKAKFDKEIKALTSCHLLFICSSEKENLKEIINLVEDQAILTVGEVEGFLESGGIINCLVEENKIHFEINTAAAERAKLGIRSQLLRLAKRIVEEDTSQKDEGAESPYRMGETNYAYFAKYDNKV
jgi:hypothetical protein